MLTNMFMLLLRGAAVLALALLAIRFARGAAASLRYTILAAALAAVLALPVIGLAVPAWHTGAIARTAEPTAVETIAIPIAEVSGPATVASVVPTPAVSEATAVPWRAIAGGVWLAGALALLVRAGVGARRARGIARRATPVDGVDKHAAAAWRALDGEGRPPRIVASDEVEAPIVVGAIAPVVVVPRTASEWVGERWRVVLLHELAHVRRRDGLVNVIAQLACCMHWVNPLAWIAARRMREERELAADDAVLRGGARASTYAEHLIAIATTTRAPASAIAMAGPSRFEARVVALLDGDRSRRPAGTGRAALVVAAAGIVTAFAACFSPDSPPRTDDVTAEDQPAAPPPLAKNPELQAVAEAELDAAIAAHKANGALAVVVDAKSGAVVALATRGAADARVTRAPGSTLKPFTFAAALEAGVVDATTKLDCGNPERTYGDKVIKDASPRGVMEIGGVLAVSSNVCTAKIAELTGDRLAGSLRRYHIPAPAQIDTTSIEGAAMASGEGIRISALDLASAYTAIADGGVYHARDGASERVMPHVVARTMLAMLERPVNDADGTGRAARIDGIRVAGKTGTIRSTTGPGHYASFAGIVPADAPRYIVLVGVDGVDGHGGKVAAPLFAKIAASALSQR